MTEYDLIVIGGGAAGFFGAIRVAEQNPKLKIIILEKGKRFLDKVRISGGGRCNVTHACFDPNELVQYYPRGQKALLGPFHQFMTGDMVAWLESHGVKTKIERDGRMFPITDSSSTIINCFTRLCKKYGIETRSQFGVQDFNYVNQRWLVRTNNQTLRSKYLLITTGSNKRIWDLLDKKRHAITPPVPSLFTFRIKHDLIHGLQGISVPNGHVKIVSSSLDEQGPILITHWGLSGPAILKLSAWGARYLNDHNYAFHIEVNWINRSTEEVFLRLKEFRESLGSRIIGRNPLFDISKRLWIKMTELIKCAEKKWASASNIELMKLSEIITKCVLPVNGKSTFKDEFVTAGGIHLAEVNFKTMESRILKKVFFAGEILDIDAVTGGFNFQAAWTTAWIAAQSIAAKS